MAARAAAALCPALAVAWQLLVCAKSFEINTYSDGWRPVPRERVFHWNVANPRLIHSVNADALIQVVDAPKLNTIAVETRSDVGQGVSTAVLPVNRRHFDSLSIMASEMSDVSHRRGKELDFNTNIIANNIERQQEDAENDKNNKEVNNNTYEVTESTTEEAVAEQNIITREGSYDYGEKKGNNFTDNLQKILSSYNIRFEDALPNYALSLKRESPKSNGYVYMRVPYRYNSMNHAPVDPVLAVFLSNYGHYVPGLYGFQSNYKNLYGYAASNNIHNNKPFGAYKIFADTDSAS